MNILFVYPTRLDSSGSPIKYRKGYLPPLALATLDSEAAFLPGDVLLVTLDGEDPAQLAFAVSGAPFAVNNFLVPASIEVTGNIGG